MKSQNHENLDAWVESKYLSGSLSTWLDFIRIAAAILVLMGHARGTLLPGLSSIISMHAAEAVAVFFVLSGFVIRYVTCSRHGTAREYTLDRISRIYSVAIPAILLTIVVDMLGLALFPDYYASIKSLGTSPLSLGLLSYLSFLNEAWGQHIVIGTLEPYWSLGYEVPYYIAFALATFPKQITTRIAFLLLWAIAFGPYILAYGFLWLIGVWTYDLVEGRWSHLSRNMGKFTSLMLVTVPVVAYPILRATLDLNFGVWFHRVPLDQEVALWAYYSTIGALFGAHILGFARLFSENSFPDVAARIIRWSAGNTFTIYLMHLPILFFFTGLLSEPAAGRIPAPLVLALILAILVALSYAGERQKKFWRRRLDGFMRMPSKLKRSGAKADL